jgi:segregation and condensation protein B
MRCYLVSGRDDDFTSDAIAAAVRQLARATGGRASLSTAGDRSLHRDPSGASIRIVEALLFQSAEPQSAAYLASKLPEGADLPGILSALRRDYSDRGVNLVEVAGKWQFRTAEDLGWLLRQENDAQAGLGRAALETLAIIAYHQPVTRTDIEQARGVSSSRNGLEALLVAGLVKPRGRRRTPGRPLTFGTTPAFLEHFGLSSLDHLPGREELQQLGLVDGPLPQILVTAEEDPLGPDDIVDASFHLDYLDTGNDTTPNGGSN